MMKFPISVLIFILITITETSAHAYIGPGAGFAVMSSFLVLLVTSFLALVTLLTWPFRAILLYFKRRKIRKRSQVRRAVVIGLDGLDPVLTQEFMDKGNLPNFLSLKKEGCFTPLRTTTPPISPVAWSSFSTGVGPGKHRIFDFFTRDPNTYGPVLSSARLSTTQKEIKLGPFRIRINKTSAQFLRKSTSFWKILGDWGVFSTVLRVPITFPPEKFYGACLSAMCTPDLLGTQGTFSLITAQESSVPLDQPTGGRTIPIRHSNGKFLATIEGPSLKRRGRTETLRATIVGTIDIDRRCITLKAGEELVTLAEGQYSPWITLEFRGKLKKRVRGVARFLLLETTPCLKIYMSPVNIDPEKPSTPVSHPSYYSVMLAKMHGTFATLGLAEDTWALNERVIDEAAFLQQTNDIFEERKAHLLDTLRKQRDGLVLTVFDTTDRIQHMFFRYLCSDHPANRGKDTEKFQHVIRDLYSQMDGLLGEVQKLLSGEDLLIILSDHGFKPFKWGVNLNSWLWREGYLVLKAGAAPGREWFADVDWSRTQAYAYGLAGIFLNVRDREQSGIVPKGEGKIRLQLEIKDKLEALTDPGTGLKPIRKVILSQQAAKGPYMNDAHDLFVGFEEGYRVSWNSAVGKITQEIFEENTRSWSGDHSIDPELVPGVFFCNWKLRDDSPSIVDIGPTILDLFGIPPTPFHDGKILTIKKRTGRETGYGGSVDEYQKHFPGKTP